MIIKVPFHISRTFIESHEYDLTFVYSNDLLERGLEGMPWNFAVQPNCFMVPTMVKFCPASRTFMDDRYFDMYKLKIDEYLNKVPRTNPVIVVPKIGKGCSRMFELAPVLFKYLWIELDKIKHPEIEWI